VVDEPFYGYYLSIRPVNHPGREEIVRSMETDPSRVVSALLEERAARVLMIKNMAHHLIDIEERFFRSVSNVFLIRNPGQLIASFAKIIAEPTMTDIGVRKQYDLFCWLRDFAIPAVLDSGDLLRDPRGVLQKLCGTLGIAFDPSMLSWKPGARPEDGIWARYWYDNVHRSTGFQVQETSSRPLPDNLLPLYEEALPLYNEMYRHSIAVP
jgi:hypothetical protein